MLIEGNSARKKISILWSVFGGVLLTLFILQFLNGKFEDKTNDAWVWLSANLLPFLTLVCSGYIIERKRRRSSQIDRIYYRLCFACSTFYLIVLLYIILSSPFSEASIIDYYKESNIFLIPLQSIVSGMIGIFFVKGHD